jgi:hypothetical protein
MKAYHGTNARFDKFDVNMARVTQDFYGGPLYFTDNLEVGKGYARTMSRKEGIPLVYEVQLTLRNTFDVDAIFTGDQLKKILEKHGKPEDFARGARLLSLGGNRLETLTKLKSGSMELTGDQVFRGLSNGMANSLAARKTLISLGYDSLRYNGGRMGIDSHQHNVYLPYNPNQIQITQRYILKPKNDKVSDSAPFKFI